MKKILCILLCVMNLKVYASEEVIKPTPLQAGIADTASSLVAFDHGFKEINPLGFVLATTTKVFLVCYANDKFDGTQKYKMEKLESSVWSGAALNNILLVVGAAPIVAVGSGLTMMLVIWNNN